MPIHHSKRRLACAALLVAAIAGPLATSGTATADSHPPKPVIKTGPIKVKKGPGQAVAQQSGPSTEGPDSAVMPNGWKVEQGHQYTRCWEDHETLQSVCETFISWPDGSETVVG
ncbi:hypothetical protein [Streptomyces sp. NPDC058989]|uniref:hypothetical protein n=1 Tax=Streptomyces sp. NPDC058989 TaxID=3346686 RepID=UPI0036B0DC47